MADPFRIQSNPGVQPAPTPAHPPRAASTQASSFAETLAEAQNLKFSNHAQKRLEKRNITLSDEGLSRLNSAVVKAEKRGGQESLVLMDDLAFIVNIRDRLVVTAMDADSRRDGVFTQIDSVVFADPAEDQPGRVDES